MGTGPIQGAGRCWEPRQEHPGRTESGDKGWNTKSEQGPSPSNPSADAVRSSTGSKSLPYLSTWCMTWDPWGSMQEALPLTMAKATCLPPVPQDFSAILTPGSHRTCPVQAVGYTATQHSSHHTLLTAGISLSFSSSPRREEPYALPVSHASTAPGLQGSMMAGMFSYASL